MYHPALQGESQMPCEQCRLTVSYGLHARPQAPQFNGSLMRSGLQGPLALDVTLCPDVALELTSVVVLELDPPMAYSGGGPGQRKAVVARSRPKRTASTVPPSMTREPWTLFT